MVTNSAALRFYLDHRSEVLLCGIRRDQQAGSE